MNKWTYKGEDRTITNDIDNSYLSLVFGEKYSLKIKKCNEFKITLNDKKIIYNPEINSVIVDNDKMNQIIYTGKEFAENWVM